MVVTLYKVVVGSSIQSHLQRIAGSTRPQRQGIRMHRHALDAHALHGAILLVHGGGVHPGQDGEGLVANDPAEDGVEPVQVRRLVERDEELRAVGPGTLVGHAEHAALGVAQRGTDLVVEGAAPDGLAALGVVRRGGGGRARLDHELGDEAVEGRGVVVAGCAEGEEILRDGVVSFFFFF